MKRKPMRCRFVRTDFMSCRCITGKCSNYDEDLCNRSGGTKVRPEIGYAGRVSFMRKALQADINIRNGGM